MITIFYPNIKSKTNILTVMTIGKSYKVVTNYRMSLVSLCSYKFFSNPSEEWE